MCDQGLDIPYVGDQPRETTLYEVVRADARHAGHRSRHGADGARRRSLRPTRSVLRIWCGEAARARRRPKCLWGLSG